MPGIHGNPYTRLSTTMITPGASAGAAAPFNALVKGTRLTPAQSRALLNAANRCAFPIGEATRVAIAFMLSLSTGVSADNATCACSLYLLTPCAGPTGVPDATCGYMADYLGLITTLTAGTVVGEAGASDLVATEHLVDTITTWVPGTASTSPDGILETLETSDSEGSNAAYSPASDSNARLVLRSLNRGSFLVFDFHTPSSNARANALIQSSNV